MPPRSEFRYQSLDHWRGIAALGVMVFHLFGTWLEAHPGARESFPLTLVAHGWVGIEVFFVISGYCIAERVARQYRLGASVGSFLLDRAWRILPIYWVALALLLAIRLASAPFNHAPPAVTPAGWLLAIPILEPWLHRPSVLTVSWTLACELFYYLLAGLCLQVACLTRRPWTGYAAALLLGVASLALPALADEVAWQLLPHFLLGVAVWSAVRFLAAGPRLLAGLLVCGTILGLTWLPGPLAGSFALRVAALFALALIVLQPWDDVIARSRFLRPLGAVGVFSYSLYLVHLPIGSPLQNLLARAWPPAADRFALVPLLLSAVAVTFAWLFYRWVEQPLEAVRRRHLARPSSSSPSSS